MLDIDTGSKLGSFLVAIISAIVTSLGFIFGIRADSKEAKKLAYDTKSRVDNMEEKLDTHSIAINAAETRSKDNRERINTLTLKVDQHHDSNVQALGEINVTLGKLETHMQHTEESLKKIENVIVNKG